MPSLKHFLSDPLEIPLGFCTYEFPLIPLVKIPFINVNFALINFGICFSLTSLKILKGKCWPLRWESIRAGRSERTAGQLGGGTCFQGQMGVSNNTCLSCMVEKYVFTKGLLNSIQLLANIRRLVSSTSKLLWRLVLIISTVSWFSSKNSEIYFVTEPPMFSRQTTTTASAATTTKQPDTLTSDLGWAWDKLFKIMSILKFLHDPIGFPLLLCHLPRDISELGE